MLKKLALTLASAMLSILALAQPTGGVKGQVVNRNNRESVSGAVVVIADANAELARTVTDSEGRFEILGLEDGMYVLVIESSEYLSATVHVTVNDGYIKNMFRLSLTPASRLAELEENLDEFDMDDSGYSDSPTVLFGSNDVFTNIASYNFSDVRYKVRGYSSESQEVYLAGVKMNDAITGYGPFSLWSGLNEATRSKESTVGNEISEYGFGGYNGVTNIFANASSMRTGTRVSVLSNSALYRLRLMGSYSTGMMDNGWSFSANISARLGGNDWIQGVYYRSFGYYLAAEKKFNEALKMGLVLMGTPGQRGKQNASTQEVYDLVGDNMYNSNWGYQNGKVRNAREARTHEPIAIMKFDFTPSNDFKAALTILGRFGRNGSTALDWYDAPDPRPDYYRNLPSYYWMENTDYNRLSKYKYAAASRSWETLDPNVVHLNWDRFYEVNRSNITDDGARSKYIQEERRIDQRDLNFAATAKWNITPYFTLNGGVNGKINKTENFKIVADLLGGDYYVNIDQFAERDFGSDPTKIQNDLEYYLSHGNTAQKLYKGDKFGYDYYAYVRKAEAWANGTYSKGRLNANLAGRVGYTTFWREGLVQKGLFPDNSKGDSEHLQFFTYAAKAAASYTIGGNMRVYGNVAYYNDAPTFNQSFISPRTRNTIMDGLTTVKTFSGDVNWQYTGNGVSARATAYYTTINDQSDLMSFYDDLQNAFTNFAMTGIDERHVGVELGLKVPTPLSGLAVQGVLSYGNYVYTSNPHMTQTVDNSESIIIDNEVVPYWKSHPVYKYDADGNALTTLAQNANGETEVVYVVDHEQQHYVPSTPQLAASLGLSWNKNYWFIDCDLQYFGNSYLDMNPLYRTEYAVQGPDKNASPQEIEYMTAQEKFDPAFLLNLSIGKSWYIKRNYQLGLNLNVKNLLNNRNVRTGGYEQTRLVDNTVSKEVYYRFDAKYFYMAGTNYMLNVYFRF